VDSITAFRIFCAGCVLCLCFASCMPPGVEEGEAKASPNALSLISYATDMPFAGTPQGGTVTLGQGGLLNWDEPEPGKEGIDFLTINTYATDSVADVVARLVQAVNSSGELPFGKSVTATVKETDSSVMVLTQWPFFHALGFLRTTDAGLDIVPGVSGFAVAFDEANESAELTWSIPSGVSYDTIRIVNNGDTIARLSGSATSHTDTSPYDHFSPGSEYFLQYQIVGMKDGRPSDISTVVVQKPVFIATRALPDGQVGVPYSATVEVVGGITLPITWSLSVSPLPPRLGLDTSNGEISGTPTEAGEYSFGMFVEDSHTPEPTVHYRIVDMKITN